MKIYTEEQVKNLLDKLDVIYSLEELTPIELPSSEEIENIAEKTLYVSMNGFIAGAKWMKEQILNQNK